MIDLHMHTTVSDGEDTVEELLKNCERENLSLIAITDHNTVDGYQELKDENVRSLFSGDIISGVELDVYVEGGAIELLLYDFDIDQVSDWVKERYRTREERQHITFNAIVEKCREHNIKINTDLYWDPNNEYAHGAIFRMLMDVEENKNHPDLQFENYREFYRITSMDKNHPLYIPFSLVYASIDEVEEKVHKAGGKLFLAHLFYYNIENKEEFLDDLFSKYDIDGIEVYHYSFTKEQIEWLKDYCVKNNLLMSGGSDYHGEGARISRIGVGKGDYVIPENLIENWYKVQSF